HEVGFPSPGGWRTRDRLGQIRLARYSRPRRSRVGGRVRSRWLRTCIRPGGPACSPRPLLELGACSERPSLPPRSAADALHRYGTPLSLIYFFIQNSWNRNVRIAWPVTVGAMP